MKPQPLDASIRLAAGRLWELSGNEGELPPDLIPSPDELARSLNSMIRLSAPGLDLDLPADLLVKHFEAKNSQWWETRIKAAAEGKPYPPHPLFQLLERYIDLPTGEADANLRPDRIMPASIAMVSPGHSRGDRMLGLFKHAAHYNGQLVLPNFDTLDRGIEGPALPLALYQLGNANPQRGGGPGAPLALRLFVESVLATPLHTRPPGQPIAINLTLRELLDRLYPGQRPSPARYWPRLMHAAEVLDNTRIPWIDPETGKGGRRHVVSVGDIPRGPSALDDNVQLIVNLPPGSGPGPQVSPHLHRWGAKSASAYNGLLNLAYRWWDPGITRVPVKPKNPRHKPGWAQVYKDPERYPELTDNDVVAITRPLSANKQRRHLVAKGWETLQELERAGELRIEGRRVMPLRKHEDESD